MVAEVVVIVAVVTNQKNLKVCHTSSSVTLRSNSIIKKDIKFNTTLSSSFAFLRIEKENILISQVGVTDLLLPPLPLTMITLSVFMSEKLPI